MSRFERLNSFMSYNGLAISHLPVELVKAKRRAEHNC